MKVEYLPTNDIKLHLMVYVIMQCLKPKRLYKRVQNHAILGFTVTAVKFKCIEKSVKDP